MNIKIRQIQESNINAVYRLEFLCIANPFSVQSISDSIENEDIQTYLAFTHEELIGFIRFSKSFDEGEIFTVAVSPEHRRKGVAQALIDYLLSEISPFGIVKIFLEVRTSNDGAIRLYEKNRFRKISVRKNYYTNPIEDAVIMERVEI